MDTDNSTKHRAVIFYITRDGHDLARKITGLYPDAEVLKFNTLIFAEKWQTVKNIICIMATGIVVRIMAPLLQDKKTDPAVVVLDEKGRFTVSLLSGHIGGANALAKKIADFLGAEPVITTASDVQGKIALDLWAVERNLFVEDFEKLKTLSTRVVNNRKLKVYSDYPFYKKAVPEEFVMAALHDGPDIIISSRIIDADALFLRPANLSVGMGCNRGTSEEEIEEVTRSVFAEEHLSFHSIYCISTIDLKKDEQGLIRFADDNEINIEFFSKDELNRAAAEHNIKESEAVKAATGAAAVAEPSALMSALRISGSVSMITSKIKRGNVTLAIAEAEFML